MNDWYEQNKINIMKQMPNYFYKLIGKELISS